MNPRSPWTLGGSLLALGGALYTIGGLIRWFGPGPELAVRMDDSASPFATSYNHNVIPLSPEFTVTGLLVVAVAFVALAFLPWGRTRLPAMLALAAGAWTFASMALPWVTYQATGQEPPAAGPPLAATLWVFGLGPLVLLVAAGVRARSADADAEPWRLGTLAFGLLLGTALMLEYVLLQVFGVSHDDPVGMGLVSGACATASGVVLLRAAQRAATPRRNRLDAPSEPAALPAG